jgi:hypothetical protein
LSFGRARRSETNPRGQKRSQGGPIIRILKKAFSSTIINKALDKKSIPWIRFFQHIFYISFIVLWFKDNFAPMRWLPVHYLFALIPWLSLTAFRTYPRIRRIKFAFPRKLSKETAAFLIVLLLAVVLRIPFLASPAGLMTSDDAVPALMGKHIAEGKTPPVCFYGQLYMGSLSSHYYALAFKVFGYTMFVLKWATLLVFLGFMAIQFVFLKEVFSFSLALAVSFFYSLPISPLVSAGLDNSSAFAFVLLLGSLLLYLSYLVGFRSREKLLPALGLAMGLAFWTHQITTAFIMTSLVILAIKIGWKTRKYATLAYWAFLGFLPQFLVEVFLGFKLIPFLTPGESDVNWAKAKAALDFTIGLLTPGRPKAGYAFFGLVLAGLISIAVTAWKKKDCRPQASFFLLPPVYYLLYVLSDFSNAGVIRYLYPFYVVLPVLLLAGFQLLKPMLRSILSFVLLLCLFFCFNLNSSLRLVEASRDRHLRLFGLISAMEETGRRYWLGEYWRSWLLTAVSKEKLIVDSYTTERYLPYSLAHWNQAESDNYVFVSPSERERPAYYARFEHWLETIGVRYEKKEGGTFRLVYDLEPRIYPEVLFMDPPKQIPRLDLELIEPRQGYLHLLFRNPAPGKIDLGFGLTVEIPGFSDRKEMFSLTQPEVRLSIPHPSEASFSFRYFIDYIGIRIPASERKAHSSLPPDAVLVRSDPVVYLRGIRPEVPPRKAGRMICEKESWLEINQTSPGASRLRLILNSPFKFGSWLWYGKYIQQVDIAVNGTSLGKRALDDGRNVLDIQVAKDILKPGANLVCLKFRYHSWFPTRSLWPFSAFLERVKLY